MRPAFWIVACYLLGSIPFSYLIARMTSGVDVRTVGSRNVGATNVLRAAGRVPAAAALLMDAGKGVVAVVGARWLGDSAALVGAAAVVVVLGHVFPIFLGFRGGKGMATAAGALAAMAPRTTLMAAVLFLVLVAWKRYVSLGSVVAAALFPVLLVLAWRLGWTGQGILADLVSSVLIGIIVVAKHSENLARLRAGTERRLGQGFPEREA